MARLSSYRRRSYRRPARSGWRRKGRASSTGWRPRKGKSRVPALRVPRSLQFSTDYFSFPVTQTLNRVNIVNLMQPNLWVQNFTSTADDSMKGPKTWIKNLGLDMTFRSTAAIQGGNASAFPVSVTVFLASLTSIGRMQYTWNFAVPSSSLVRGAHYSSHQDATLGNRQFGYMLNKDIFNIKKVWRFNLLNAGSGANGVSNQKRIFCKHHIGKWLVNPDGQWQSLSDDLLRSDQILWLITFVDSDTTQQTTVAEVNGMFSCKTPR